MLPGGLPREMVRSPDWRARIAIEPQLLYCGGREMLDQAQAGMERLAYKRVDRTRNEYLVPASYGFGVAYFRTYREVSYGATLAAFPELEFHGPSLIIKPDMLLWSRPIIRGEFRYLQRSSTQYYFDRMVRFERRARSRHRYLVPYPHLEIERIRYTARPNRYVPFPAWWSKAEVPSGCFAELSLCVYYVGSRLPEDRHSGYCSLVAAEWAARVAVHLLWEAYMVYPTSVEEHHASCRSVPGIGV